MVSRKIYILLMDLFLYKILFCKWMDFFSKEKISEMQEDVRGSNEIL